MAALAAPSDVEQVWRPLRANEHVTIHWLLDYASEIVRREVPTVDARVADGSLSAVLVAGTVAGAVARVMRNRYPDPGAALDPDGPTVDGWDTQVRFTAEEIARLQDRAASRQWGTIRVAGALEYPYRTRWC